jgi:hypothetical protein
MSETKKRRTPRSRRIELQITDEIIECAISRDSQHCMIADAIKAAVPDAQKIAVDLATIRFTDPKKRVRYTYLTPRIAQVELVKFDQGIKTEPFSFQLRAAQVTRSGSSQVRRHGKESMSEGRRNAMRKAQATNPQLKKQGLRSASAEGSVPERVGGRTPPLQVDSDGVPFSRRRAFGIRGLQL